MWTENVSFWLEKNKFKALCDCPIGYKNWLSVYNYDYDSYKKLQVESQDRINKYKISSTLDSRRKTTDFHSLKKMFGFKFSKGEINMPLRGFSTENVGIITVKIRISD